MLLCEMHEFHAVGCFSEDVELLTQEQSSDPFPHDRMIVCQNDAYPMRSISNGISIVKSVPRF